jgi:hypothetical protein
MDDEEQSTKRKTDKDTHSPRPGHPRFSDLFEQPCSGAPVIINLTSEPKSFLKLGITEKLHFMNALTNKIGQVKAGTKWTYKGSLSTKEGSNIYPSSMTQKRKLLDLKVGKNFHFVCSFAMSEASLRDIIRNVPTNDSEEDLLMLLTDQGVGNQGPEIHHPPT